MSELKPPAPKPTSYKGRVTRKLNRDQIIRELFRIGLSCIEISRLTRESISIKADGVFWLSVTGTHKRSFPIPTDLYLALQALQQDNAGGESYLIKSPNGGPLNRVQVWRVAISTAASEDAGKKK